MRIVHLSDIHLSKSNYDEFQNNYKNALIKDLLEYHSSSTPIDLIVITGDLVDKGGYSLFEIPGFETQNSPYDIFEIVFLDPIIQALKIDKHSVLFIPGNHDIDEKEILLFDESELIKNMNHTNINNYLSENIIFKHSHRIRKFKEFEERYHDGNLSYKYSQNQSTYIFQDKSGIKVGFLLINDSWRCKSIKLAKDYAKHYFGIQQFYDGIEFLDGLTTELNICLLHHSVEDYIEGDAVKGILQRKNIELFLYGHFHNTDTNILYTPHGNCKGFRGRAALFKPEEKESKYHSGYQILDIDLNAFILTQIHYRKYNNSDISKSFNMDIDTAPNNGIDKNNLNNDKGFELQREGRKSKKSELDINQFKS
nr:metallophosphoesterase [uncultured Flavobacterium sp.]